MIEYAIEKITKSKSLSLSEAQEVFSQVLEAKVTSAQLAALLIGLKIKGESIDEIAGAVKAVQKHALKIQPRPLLLGVVDQNALVFDCCGTGGSGINKFNISSTAAFVIAASGIIVAKHGNRAMSSTSGSADALESAGINIAVEPKKMEQAIQSVGIGFLYAPMYHPALKIAGPVRKEIGVRTIFNIIGPLCNPADATNQLMGVYQPSLGPIAAKVLVENKTKCSWVVYNQELKDEVGLIGKTFIWQARNKKITKFSVSASDFGLKKVLTKDLVASNASESAKIMSSVLNGKKGPARDIVLANAACGLVILSKAKTLRQGVKIAADLIDSSKALEKFIQLKQFLT